MVFLFVMSGVINMLALTGAFYMLQIYDRALTGGSIPTLVALSVLAIGLYLFQGMFDVIRSQVLVRVGARLDKKVAPLAHRVAIDMPRFGFSTAESLERGRDVDTVRGFLGSAGTDRAFRPALDAGLPDLRLSAAPLLGALTLGGAVVLALLTIATELMTRRLSAATQQAVITRNTIADSNARNADILKAMGFAGRAVERFNAANDEHLALQTKTNDISGTFGALSGPAHAAPVGAPRPRRLSDDQGRSVGRRHHRVVGGIVTRAGADRSRHRQLEERGRGAQAFQRLRETVVALARRRSRCRCRRRRPRSRSRRSPSRRRRPAASSSARSASS